ncbi:hypothetical protein H0H87_009593 [Tephrocybe sp. NHM501043]|nr:hypothetical protein H0H87_009593 [Tephrocybe sp. NHM501043]
MDGDLIDKTPSDRFPRDSMLVAFLHDWFHLSFRSPPFRVLAENWIICAALIAATCLLRCCYKGFPRNYKRDTSSPTPSPPNRSSATQKISFGGIFARIRRRRPPGDPSLAIAASPKTSSPPQKMRNSRQSRWSKKTIVSLPFPAPPPPPRAKQHYEAFLVLDVEATCQQGTDFNFPNEIIEFPVCLMRWKDRTDDLKASQLEVVAEFRSFVKPTWQPNLSQFCTELTGITQVSCVSYNSQAITDPPGASLSHTGTSGHCTAVPHSSGLLAKIHDQAYFD